MGWWEPGKQPENGIEENPGNQEYEIPGNQEYNLDVYCIIDNWLLFLLNPFPGSGDEIIWYFTFLGSLNVLGFTLPASYKNWKKEGHSPKRNRTF